MLAVLSTRPGGRRRLYRSGARQNAASLLNAGSLVSAPLRRGFAFLRLPPRECSVKFAERSARGIDHAGLGDK